MYIIEQLRTFELKLVNECISYKLIIIIIVAYWTKMV
jgi:hypothetical protein